MWAARPHLGSIFEKLLHRKTFWLPAARILQPLFPITKKHLFTKMLSDDSRFYYACSFKFNPNFFAANAANISTVPSNPRQAVFTTKSRNSRLSTGYPVYFK